MANDDENIISELYQTSEMRMHLQVSSPEENAICMQCVSARLCFDDGMTAREHCRYFNL